jgi:uncharacterized membrane protein YsdA (DUF1294 family)
MSLAPDRGHRNAPAERGGSSRDLSRPLPAALSWCTLVAFIATFGIAFVTLGLPWWMPALYLAMSLVAFAAYGFDKAAAGRGARRVSEQTLIALGLVCGWPGALVAQQLLRHKTRKRSFRRRFWRSVVLNVLLVGAFVALATVRGWDLTLSWLPLG